MSTSSSSKDHYLPSLQHNLQALQYVKSTSASIAGATAGFLGLTNTLGFLFYVVSSVSVGLAYCWIKCGAKPGVYFAKGGREVAMSGLLDNLFPFVLFWTLFYALVYIYG